ncbi:MAG TPA: DUF4381 domain-containing protein, partial [Leucothrix sp.]|nr:DUF4381 domain-containing protein [Leucothrix sp.]
LINNPDNEAIASINIFLRQLAISKYPRSDIASLTGAKWLQFLDESGNTQEFTKGAGRILVDAPYQSGELQNLNSAEFTPLMRSWIKKVVKRGGWVYEFKRHPVCLNLGFLSSASAVASALSTPSRANSRTGCLACAFL